MESLTARATAIGIALPFLYSVWRLSGSYLYTHFSSKTTVLREIENLGKARPADKRIKGTAVIIGGSIAGLWSALVAADHFENVLIIEPEAWLTGIGKSNQYNADGIPIREEEAPPRTRVAQFAFCHLYQPLTFSALLKFFPHFHKEVEEAGGRNGPFIIDFLVGGKEIWRVGKNNPDADYLQSFFISRDGYERILRRLILGSTSRVKWLTGTVTGFNVVPEDTSMLSSVDVRLSDGKTSIPAAFVIDCTGATQVGLKLLRRIAPEDIYGPLSWKDIRITFDCGITCTMFRVYVPGEARESLPIPGGYYNRTWYYTSLPIPGKTNLALYVNRIEGHCINFLFCGWGDPQLPESVDEIKSWCKSFEIDHAKIPDWLHVLVSELLIKGDTNEVQFSKIRASEQQWTFWDSAPYLPSNFVAIGDSVQVTNPMYGQGCLKAATSAIALDGMLKKKPFLDQTEILPGFGRQFFKRQREILEPIWEGNKPADYMFPTTKPIEGESPSEFHLWSRFGSLVTELATYDNEVDTTLYNVRTLVAPPQTFFRPRLLLKYVFFMIRKQLGFLPVHDP